jgi:hypothetical protein
MKKLAFVLASALLVAHTGAFAAEQTWTGKISDSACGAARGSGRRPGRHGRPRLHPGLYPGRVEIRSGRDGKVLQIANQDNATWQPTPGTQSRSPAS